MSSGDAVCLRCVVDRTVPGAVFDDAGVCSYCHLHDAMEQAWPTGPEGRGRLDELVATIKRSGAGRRYDCIVGISGGTDSTYSLYLARELGLRPLAVHFDNGWCSEISVSNIRKVLTQLDVDLQTYVVDWEEFRDLQVAYLRSSLPWADTPTDEGIIAALDRIAKAEGVRWVITGGSFRTEGKMPSEWTYGDARMIRHIQRRFGTKPLRSYPYMTLSHFVWRRAVSRIGWERPLNYVDYSKVEAQRLLSRELGWEYYGGHHYENIYTRFVYSYWLPVKFDIDKRKITHAALVRSGEMTREAALSELLEPPQPPDRLEADVEYVVKKLRLSREEFDELLERPNRGFRDYPSYYPLYERFTTVARLASTLLLSWTPPLLLEMDARRRAQDGSAADQR